ncbi:MAG: (2Fe-2S) ferredoxin domain-containing protein [Limnothrix sp. RL_2_0]|nr:(2Fe-2S) ferredoxin domain-containing protein [Limnothrix sp. RL_2_0]
MPQEIFEVHSPLQEGDRHILVCQNTSCREKQAAAVLAAFKATTLPASIKVYPSNCQGQCSIAATVRIVPDETWYCRVLPEDVSTLSAAIAKGEIIREKLNPRIHRYY